MIASWLCDFVEYIFIIYKNYMSGLRSMAVDIFSNIENKPKISNPHFANKVFPNMDNS